jgi:hypothetical protein
MRCPRCKKRYIRLWGFLRAQVSLSGLPPCMHCGAQLVPRHTGPPPLFSGTGCSVLLIMGVIAAVALGLGCPADDVLLVALLCLVPVLTIIGFLFPTAFHVIAGKSSRHPAKEAGRDPERNHRSGAGTLARKFLLLPGLTFFVVIVGLSLKRGDSFATLVDRWGLLFLIFACYALTSLARSSALGVSRSLMYEIGAQAALLTMLIAYGDPVAWGIWICGTAIYVKIRVSMHRHREAEELEDGVRSESETQARHGRRVGQMPERPPNGEG